jgi:hypothetical protein
VESSNLVQSSKVLGQMLVPAVGLNWGQIAIVIDPLKLNDTLNDQTWTQTLLRALHLLHNWDLSIAPNWSHWTSNIIMLWLAAV